jgi:uncharacterized protein YciI
MAWYVKIEKGIVEKNIFDRYVRDHKDYVRQLIERGHQAKTGYWGDFGGGMLLFEANSLEEAREIVARDPLIVNGCVTYELHEWKIVME